VKQIIVALSLVVKAIYEDPTQDFHWNAFPVEQYLRGQHATSVSCFKTMSSLLIIFLQNIKPSKRYSFLFSPPQEDSL
jgi:hypothetical protein